MLFAHMKQHFRFTRLKLRGLAGAAEEFLLVATPGLPHKNTSNDRANRLYTLLT
jgi:hypothetical protein